MVSLLILAYIWFSVYRAIRREGKIKVSVWAIVIALALLMTIPAGMLTDWGKGSWALIFDRPQMDELHESGNAVCVPIYNEVFPPVEYSAFVLADPNDEEAKEILQKYGRELTGHVEIEWLEGATATQNQGSTQNAGQDIGGLGGAEENVGTEGGNPCQCNAPENVKQTGGKIVVARAWFVYDYSGKKGKILAGEFGPGQDIPEKDYCSEVTYFVVPKSKAIMPEILSLEKDNRVTQQSAKKPSAAGLMVFTIILAIIIGGMEMMLRVFYPPVVSATSQYGGSGYVWLVVLGIIIFFLEAFFAFTIGGLLVTWFKLLMLPPLMY